MVSYEKLKLIEFLRKEELPLVTTNLLRNLSGLENEQSLTSFINSLIKYEILEKAERGKYLVKDNLGNDFLLANLLYPPSYVSLETALNLDGILSQFPMEVSSVTTKRKKNKVIAGKLYTYYHLAPKLFWGMEKKEGTLMARPEKALLDIIYFTSKGIKRVSIEDLDLSSIDKEIFASWAKRFPKTKRFDRLVKKVLTSNQ